MSSTHVMLSPVIVKNISDKMYDRRKIAALEVESLVKSLVKEGKMSEVYDLVDLLAAKFALSSQSNSRKGGLLCLAATAVGLAGSGSPEVQSKRFSERIVPPILASFTAPDSRVRYYALEALFNVAKSTRPAFLNVFPLVFDALFRLCSDSEPSVQNAAAFLDNLVKDCVAETVEFDFNSFLPMLESCMAVDDPRKRSFLLGWLNLIETLPTAERALLKQLPCLLPGVLSMLSDTNPEVRQSASKLLNDLRNASSLANSGALAAVLAAQLLGPNGGGSNNSGGQGDSHHQEEGVEGQNQHPPAAQLLILQWLLHLVEDSSDSEVLLLEAPAILRAFLPCLGATDGRLHGAARDLSGALLELVSRQGRAEHATALMEAAVSGLESGQEAGRLEGLRWMKELIGKGWLVPQGGQAQAEAEENAQLNTLMNALCEALCSAASDKVVQDVSGVLAAVAAHEPSFDPVISAVLQCFKGTSGLRLLQRRGTLIIRCLCIELGSWRVLLAIARWLRRDDDLPFIAIAAQAVNLVLITAPEVQPARSMLQRCMENSVCTEFFEDLLAMFSHSTGAALSLCLLSGAYEVAWGIIQALTSPDLLPRMAHNAVELSQLVSILECPSFAALRLQLLFPQQNVLLLRCLYGVLMLLPQGDAFRVLQSRLSCVPSIALLPETSIGGGGNTFSYKNAGLGSEEKQGEGSRPDRCDDGSPLMDAPELIKAFVQIQMRNLTGSTPADQVEVNGSSEPRLVLSRLGSTRGVLTENIQCLSV